MKAISVRDNPPPENWATLIETLIKTIETRTWNTNYRGDLLICCSASSKSANAGHAVCVVELYDVRPMRKEDESAACIELYPRAYSWKLRNLRLLSRKFRVRGRLSLFDVDIPSDVTLRPVGPQIARESKQFKLF